MSGHTIRIAALAAAVALALPASASAHHKHRPWRVTSSTVLGHHVVAASYLPGHRVRLRAAGTGHALRTPLIWGSRVRAVAAMNADTWTWGGAMPVGATRVEGHWVHKPRRGAKLWTRPAVGFLHTGRIVFGAKMAVRHNAANIISGPAYLIRGGVVQHSYPWAHNSQINCGLRYSGHRGCYRSNVVRFKSGRVGMVEVAFADMLETAKILKRMGVVDALTFDSGGSAVLGYRPGLHHAWAQFGVNHHFRLGYLRAVPDAVCMEVGR